MTTSLIVDPLELKCPKGVLTTMVINIAQARFAILMSGIVMIASTLPSLASAEEKGNTQERRRAELTVSEFERLHNKLRKMSVQRVWSIPWQLSVRKARELAAKERKPVFLWISSNGGTHPLGPC